MKHCSRSVGHLKPKMTIIVSAFLACTGQKSLQTASVTLFRDVTEPANVGCGFHVQNPSDSDTDADLSRDQNY